MGGELVCPCSVVTPKPHDGPSHSSVANGSEHRPSRRRARGWVSVAGGAALLPPSCVPLGPAGRPLGVVAEAQEKGE